MPECQTKEQEKQRRGTALVLEPDWHILFQNLRVTNQNVLTSIYNFLKKTSHTIIKFRLILYSNIIKLIAVHLWLQPGTARS